MEAEADRRIRVQNGWDLCEKAQSCCLKALSWLIMTNICQGMLQNMSELTLMRSLSIETNEELASVIKNIYIYFQSEFSNCPEMFELAGFKGPRC